MTKREVRVCALAQLGVRRGDVVWDIGAGTGSVSVELALLASDGEVWAVERNEEACALIARNRVRFGAYGVHLAPGEAPEVLDALPTPDAVFVGGSGGRMDEILPCGCASPPLRWRAPYPLWRPYRAWSAGRSPAPRWRQAAPAPRANCT